MIEAWESYSCWRAGIIAFQFALLRAWLDSLERRGLPAWLVFVPYVSLLALLKRPRYTTERERRRGEGRAFKAWIARHPPERRVTPMDANEPGEHPAPVQPWDADHPR